MAFATESEAKHFLIDKIAASAIAEGIPLSDNERRMLRFSESTAEPAADSGNLLDPDDFGAEFEERMARLLRHAYELDGSSDVAVRRLYREALDTLSKGDHYLSWVGHLAGLGSSVPTWLRPLKPVLSFAFLVVPALVALLIAGAGLWAAVAQSSRSSREAVGMSVVAIVFAGFAAFLLALWFRERRG